MLLMIDNYDSFTYNIVHYLEELGSHVKVCRNDEISLTEIEQLSPSQIVISPGPCTPDQAGISNAVIQKFIGQIPILGVCLGHQCIGQVLGANIVIADKVMHGKLSNIEHNQKGVFKGLKNPLTVTRYHSLVIDPVSLPDCLEVTAWVKNDKNQNEIMGIRHREFALEGVQFHPESVLSEQGHQLFANFLEG